MRGAILTRYNEPLTIERIDPFPLGPLDVRLEVEASGVCHSDWWAMSGLYPLELPVIMGHEGAGRVLEVGSHVTRVKPGDRIVAALYAACGHCWHCVRDETNLCETHPLVHHVKHSAREQGDKLEGLNGLGTFADEMVIDESFAVKVETDLPGEQLALLGCGVTTGTCAALNTARVTPGATVAVVGCGGVGQSVIQGAAIAGAARIIAVDPVQMKRDVAAGFGATDFVDPGEGDPIEQVREATAGRGADFTFEVVGRPETMTQAYEMARKGGTAVMVGAARTEDVVSFNAFELHHEKTIKGCTYGSAQVHRDLQMLVDLAENGRLDLERMVTRTFALEDINEAFEAMHQGTVVRGVVVP
jgi:S-(hydroxymethyl)glutathione dehydrogenase/alcohol dehydrogenase